MRAFASTTLAALAVAALLGALSLVAWRQARAREALASLDGIRRERSLGLAERAELLGRIRHLESRARVVPESRERLGMRLPDATEIVILAPEGS